jgi:1,4-alpha-glucan branching enzyme
MNTTKHSNTIGGNWKKFQLFSIYAPGATSVQLVGDFTKWQRHPIHLQKEGPGIWRTEVELEPGEHHYRFLVDGEWRDDPECRLRVPNPYGTQDSVLQVA